jgi:UDP-2,3-diacylglucosamine pyrophosphatase LpxH
MSRNRPFSNLEMIVELRNGAAPIALSCALSCARVSESILVFSDVHLGSDLNDSGPHVPRSVTVDRDLARMLAHYRETKPPADRWRVVIAGDFIDFVGMSIDPKDGEKLETELTPEERRNGVGSAEDHARLKLERVGVRHASVFAELGKLVAAGHAITVLHGNHDIELHWDALKSDLRELVLAGVPESERASARERIDFEPWFFYREGVVYIEHGHQYDPFCSTSFILAPVSPRDPRRVERGFSEMLLRSIVRRTPGLKEHGHEDRGLASYVSWAFGLGIGGALALLSRFFGTMFDLTKTQRAYTTKIAAKMRADHERRVAERAERARLGKDRLDELLSLQLRPIGTTFRGVLASVMLDRLALGIAVVVGIVIIALLARYGPLAGYGYHATGVLLTFWIAMHFALSWGRGSVDPAKVMTDRASRIAKLFRAPYVVMGHTHVPLSVPAGDATYINVGSWAEEEDPTSTYRAARTHLVIHEREDRPEALFYEWHPEEGPRLKT